MVRRAILVIATAIALLVVFVAAGVLFLQTEPGGRAAARALASLASTPGERDVGIAAVEPGLPSRLALSGLVVRDSEGEWLAVEEVVIDWRPLALLRGRLVVREAAARGVRLSRLPEGDPDATTTTVDGSLPTLPLDLEVERFTFDDVQIGPAVAGEPIDLRADGRLAAASAGRVETTARIVRTNGVGGEADLTATWIASTRALILDARLNEPAGGLIGATLGLAGQPPVRLTVSGEGPLEAWRGDVSGAIGGDIRLNAEIRSEPTPFGIRTHVSGRADIAALLGPPLRALVADGIAFGMALRRPGGEAVHVDALEIAAGALRLTGSGIIDPEAGWVETAEVRLVAADASALAPLLAPASAGSLDAEAEIAGSWTAPTIAASGAIDGLRFSDTAVDRFVWTARIAPPEAGDKPIAFKATANLSGVRAGATDFAALLGGDPRLTIDAALDREANRLTLRSARLETPGLALTGEGSADLANGDGKAKVRATIEDLATFGAVTGLDLAGRADLNVEADSSDGRLQGRFQLAAEAVRTGLAPVDVGLGSSPSLRGRVSAEPAAQSVRLGDVVLDGASVQAEASAELTDGVLSAAYRARVPDLAPVAAAAGIPAQGALDLTGTLAGDPADPAARATVSLENGRIADLAVAPARAEITAEALGSTPRGTLNVTAKVEGDPVRARIRFAGTDDGTLRLGPFDANAPGATASGTLRLSPAGGPILGTVVLRTGSGGKPATLAGTALAGETEATLRLGARGGEQTIDIEANGRSPALTTPGGPAGSAGAVSLRASLAGPPGQTRGQVDAKATALKVGGAVLDAVDATISGSADAAAFNITTRLPGAEANEIRSNGTVRRTASRSRIVVDSLDGPVGGEALVLRQPLVIDIDDQGARVADLDLAVGNGGIAGSGRTGDGGTEGSLIVRDLPLALAAGFLPDLNLAGTLDARGSVRTHGAALAGDLVVDLNAVHVAGMAPDRAMDVTATARLGDGALALQAGSEIAGRPLDIAARVPVSIDARTLAIQLAPQAPLSGGMSWSGPVAELWELLPLPDQRLTGRVEVDLRLGGTVADPRIDGAAVLSDGRYENFVTATVIEDLAAGARANGTGTVALTLRGNDGERGTVAGDGTVTLGSGGKPLADLTVTFAEATLVRRDDVTATLSGTITLRQSPEGARIGGRITTDRVEVRLIDRLPPSVVVLDVKEINLPPGQGRPPPEDSGAPAWSADLDLAVSMPRRVFVRGRGLESEWQGDLRVTGTTAAPVLTGSVNARSGVFDFAGRRFTIERGDIGFTGGNRIAPTLNVVAVREVTDLTARITVTGTASAPEIELSSQPALPDSEILARILFGKDVAKLGPVELAQLGFALDTLASGESLSEDALSYVRSLLGLDVLSVETGDEDGIGPAIGVGRYVSDGVYVGARQGVGGNSTAGTVEVEILPGLSVESEVGGTGQGTEGALGLRWRWDY